MAQLHICDTPRYAAAQWKRIGLLLKIDDITLDNIAQHNQNDEDCFRALWEMWFCNDVTALAWKKAINVISVTLLMQELYKNKRSKDKEDNWIQFQSDSFANLSILHHSNRLPTAKQIEAVAMAMHKGEMSIGSNSSTNLKDSTQPSSNSYIASCKQLKCAFDIFYPNEPVDNTQNILLIEGASGFGKTVLSREIAFQWAIGKLLCNKILLFLIHLHDPLILQIETLEEFVCHAIKSSPNDELIKFTVEHLRVTSGKYCTILLDGYDKLSEVRKDSFVSKIIKREQLPLCGLVITSCPSASAGLHRIVDSRFEILGFTRDGRSEYVHKNLHGDDIVKLQDYLQSNSVIGDLCYIPLNMTILLHLFKEFASPDFSKTQTDIINQFIYITMSSYISKQMKEVVTIKSPDDMQVPYKKQFNYLCELAFDLVRSEKVVFSSDDVRKYISKNITASWSTLGLLKEVNYYSLLENELKTSYAFMHSSMQECLVAHHVASSKEVENYFLNNYFWDSRYLNSGFMYVELTQGKSNVFKKFLSGYTKTLSKSGSFKVKIHSKIKKLHFFNCLLENKSTELSKQLLVDVLYESTIDLSDQRLEPTEIHLLGFFLSRYTIKSWEKLNLSNCSISKECLEKFSLISNDNISGVSIDIVDLSGNDDISQSVNATVSVINRFKVKKLIIADNVAEDTKFKRSLLLGLTTVKELVISSNDKSSNLLINCKLNENQDFLNKLEFKVWLFVWNTNPLLSISNVIANCNAINICDENLSDEKITDIVSELKSICKERNKKITYTLHSTNKIIAYGAEFYQILHCLRNHTFSLELQNLELFDLSGCKLSDNECISLYEYLESCTNDIIHINVLNLSYNNLTSLSLVAIFKILRKCIIKILIISRNTIKAGRFEAYLDDYFSSKQDFLNVTHKIPLLIYESKNDSPPYEICNVYAFTSDVGVFHSHIYENKTLYNLYHVHIIDQKYKSDKIFSVLLTNSTIEVTLLTESVMNEKIVNMIVKLTEFNYTKDATLTKVDFSHVAVTNESCKILSTFFETSIDFIEELYFSSENFSLTCLSTIVELFQYCVIRKLVLPSIEALGRFNDIILENTYAGKKNCNFIKRIPLTVYMEYEDEEDNETVYNTIANTYLRNYPIQNLKELFKGLVVEHLSSTHTFVFFDCLAVNDLKSVLSFLNVSPCIKICVLKMTLPNESLLTSVELLETYGNRVQYVLDSDTKVVVYNAHQFQMVRALKSLQMVCDLEISHCKISKDIIEALMQALVSNCKVLKNLKVIKCEIKDEDLYDFCVHLYSASSKQKSLIQLKTMDFSHNHLSSYCISTILKLLECSVIEKLIMSNNYISNGKLTDAIFEQAYYKESEICNSVSGIPLVIINSCISSDSSQTEMGQIVTIYFMKCKIDKSTHDLLLEYSSKRVYFICSEITLSDLQMNLQLLHHHSLPHMTNVVVYEDDLKDEVAVKAAALLKERAKLQTIFTLASQTRILANGSNYDQVALLVDSNASINTLQLTNFDTQFPSDGQFVKVLTNTRRNWKMIDLSSCSIGDGGCLRLQKCLVASKSTVEVLNITDNNLSSISCTAIASIILNCIMKKVNISCNKLQDSEVRNAVSYLKKNFFTDVVGVEIFTSDSTTIIASNINPEHLPYEICSPNHKIQLSIMHYHHFAYIQSILSSFCEVNLSQVICQHNSLTMEQIENIVSTLPGIDLHVEEPNLHYDSNFTDYSLQSLMVNLEKITKDNNTLSPYSTLIFGKVNFHSKKICIYHIKILNSVYCNFTNLIQMCGTLVAIKLSNCYVTHSIATNLASIIIELTDLKLFELSYNYIQEVDFKEIIEALKLTDSLIFFTIKSIKCFSENIAEGIANIIASNTTITYLEISNCNLKQTMVIKIAKSIKELRELKQLNLNDIILTHEALSYALEEKFVLEELSLSHCRLQEPEIVKITSHITNSKFSSLNLSYNNISDNAGDALKRLFLCSPSVRHVNFSNCNMQEEGMLNIINSLKHRSLNYLNFSGNKITDFLATEISAGISNNSCMESLDLFNCCLQETGVEEILIALKEHTTKLKSFKISYSFLNKETVGLFECVLACNRNIEDLTLQDCDSIEIFDMLSKRSSSLQFLNISSSILSFHNLVSIVANNVALKHLDISHCDVQDELDLTHNKSSGIFLEYLNLSGNRITKTFAKFICKLICVSHKLKHLDITNCKMQERELLNIMDSLTTLTNLNYLNCSSNPVTHQVATNIAKVLTSNIHLEQLNISMCYLNEQTFLPIANALKQLKFLKCLNASSNYFDSSSISQILYADKNEENLYTDLILPCSSASNDYMYETITRTDKKIFPHHSKSVNTGRDDNISTIPGELSNKNEENLYTNLTRHCSSASNDHMYETITRTDTKTFPHHPESVNTNKDGNISGQLVPSCFADRVSSNALTNRVLEKTVILQPTINTTLTDHNGDYDTMSLTDIPQATDEGAQFHYSDSKNVEDENDYDHISIKSGESTPPSSSDENSENSSNPYFYDYNTTMQAISNTFPNHCDIPENSTGAGAMILHSSSGVKKTTGDYDMLLARNRLESTLISDYDTIPKINEITPEYSAKHVQPGGSPTEDILSTIENYMALPKYPADNKSENKLVTIEYYESTSLVNTSIAIGKITEAIACNCFVECLDISDCRLLDLQIATVATSLSKALTLKDLNLSNNTIATDSTAIKIASAIKSNSSLQSINLSNCGLQQSSIAIIANALATVKSLVSIDISRNSFTDSDAHDIALAIKENSLLETINLSECIKPRHKPNEKGMHYILMSLTVLTYLKHLNLHSCYINDYDASKLLPIVITNNKSLIHLDLTNCKLQHKGLISIAKKLSNATLKYLSLSSNYIAHDVAVHEVAVAVGYNYSLQHLALSGCELDERRLIDIAKALLNISSIRCLDLSYNVISDRAAKTLALGIINNAATMTYLDLSFCTWQDAGFARIHQAIDKLPVVKEVNIQSL